MAEANESTVIYPELNGKRAVITGAGKGIGAALVHALVSQGCFVNAISRTQADLDKLSTEFDSTQVKTILLDVSNWKEVNSVFNNLEPFDYLINNAGVAITAPFLEVTEKDIDTTFDINIKACMHIAQCAARKMVENDIKGVIINISSQAAVRPVADHTVYCCSKAALDMLTKMMSLELGPRGIRTLSVNPTVVLTDMGVRVWSDPVKSGPMLKQIPLGKFAQLDDVIKPILFCLSDGGAMMQGSNVLVDGGFCSA